MAEPTTGTGREWGTSVRKAPNVTSSPEPRSRAVSMTSVANVRQRTFGSAALNSTTSLPSGEAAANVPAGQSITRLTPSSSLTVGRVTWKS